MPYASPATKVRLYFEEAGSGHPSSSCMNRGRPHHWEPQMRYSRGTLHRLFSGGYTPSDVPPSSDVYTYKHVYNDALARARHLKIDQSASSACRWDPYSSLQIGPERAGRALSLTLAV